ncbi:MAG: M20/M25/M40 family metallo-hydrolase [Acidobacteria bacterium]|nr:M20/M25/M40 family metallo-hydrolase [Acidobacteriota bacterium]
MLLRFNFLLLLTVMSMVIAQAADVAPGLVVLARNERLAALGTLPDGMTVLQVLDDVLVAKCTAVGLEQAAAAGLLVRWLADWDDGTEYLLVAVDDDADLRQLAARGQVAPVTDGVALFWTPVDIPGRALIPGRLPVKRLSRRAVSVDWPGEASAADEPGLELTYDPLIATMAAAVSMENLTGYIQTLQDFRDVHDVRTRDARWAGCRQAGNYLYDFFREMGLEVEFDDFSFYGYNTRNVVATLPGRCRPEEVVIICAHYDSINRNGVGEAPGADDNASGTAVVMEAAWILRHYSLENTVRFVCFSAEEWGLFGSEHFAAAAADDGENIVAVVNLDMVAYTDFVPEDLDIICNGPSIWLGQLFAAAAEMYTDLDVKRITNPMFIYSDHSSFWDNGYSAVCGIEDANVTYPYYHSEFDTFDKLNMDFCTRSARAAVSAVAELAAPVPIIAGDVDWNGSVDSVDMVLLAAVLSENLAWPSGGGEIQADLNEDGLMNAVDLLELHRRVSGPTL